MHRDIGALAFVATLARPAQALLPSPLRADEAQIARGRYLVTISGCSDCHTPGALLGAPDMQRYLGGSDVGFAVPGAGVFVGANLTSDKDTGLGAWTDDQIVVAIRAGKTPDERQLSPVMPYPALSHLTDADALAIVAFLRSLPPVRHKVRNLGLTKNTTIDVSVILPPEVYRALPAAQK